MKAQGALDAITLQERLALADFFENLARKVFSFEEQAKVRLVKRGIVEQSEENLGG